MKVNRDQFFQTVRRMRKHLVRDQVDAWRGMIRLLRGQGQHGKQIEIQASTGDVEWSERIDAKFGSGDYYGPKDKVNTPPDKDLTLARIGCEVLYRALKDRFAPATDIDLVVEGAYLKLTSPKDTRWQKPVLLPREPTQLQAVTERCVAIAPMSLHALLSQVAFTRSVDETRPHLTSVELAQTPSELRATATDGHRLATATLKNGALKPWTILLPPAAINSLLAALRESGDATVELAVGATALTVEGSAFAVFATAVSGDFPPWRQICPREGEGTRMVFGTDGETQSLRDAIAHATKVAKVNNVGINGIFTFDRGRLTIQVVDSGDLSRVLDTVETEVAEPTRDFEVPLLKTCFDLSYWQDALDSIPREHAITIQYDRELDPVAIYAGNATHVIMPCRL